jgi:hypothetical protein
LDQHFPALLHRSASGPMCFHKKRLSSLMFVFPPGWVQGIHPYSMLGLLSLNSAEIFDMALPAGDYVFYLALDNNADNIPDATWFDAVKVKVEEID